MTNFSATLAKSCSHQRNQNRRKYQNRAYWAERFISAYWISISASRTAIRWDKVKSRCEPDDRNKLPKWLTWLVKFIFRLRSWEHMACVLKGLKTIKVNLLIFTLFRRYSILVLKHMSCSLSKCHKNTILWYGPYHMVKIMIWTVSYGQSRISYDQSPWYKLVHVIWPYHMYIICSINKVYEIKFFISWTLEVGIHWRTTNRTVCPILVILEF